ncbi:hypothetical protein DRB96_18235 [Streptomyces sp. ICC1]|nr:hypothetical protein DRB96_18235 [Streptomyces sp. ICC1]
MGDQLAGRYRLEQRLGMGGMGEVWRAHDTALDRAVAVKVVLESIASEEAVARFRREATIGARLQHPGITVVHDVGQESGRLFIVMELLSGEDLHAALARVPGGLPVDVAVELAAQTAEALAAAHELGVVHRDLKPPNLFLLPGGRLKICDFGIAHSADATAGWTVTGRTGPGSPPYMAPEQWRGEQVDARCDLYALGCVLYALLSGEPPFGQSEGPWVLMRRHIEEPPLPLREAGTPVPPDLDRLVLRLLAKDAADRPESAAAVAESLRGLLDGSAGRGRTGIAVAAGGAPGGGAGRGGRAWGHPGAAGGGGGFPALGHGELEVGVPVVGAGAGSTTGTPTSSSPCPRAGKPTSTLTFQAPGGRDSAVVQPAGAAAGSRTSRQGPIVRAPSALTAFTVAATASSTASPSFSQVMSAVTRPSRCPFTTTFTVSPWACATTGASRIRPRAVRTVWKAIRMRIVAVLRVG